jgi:hypothetical protein
VVSVVGDLLAALVQLDGARRVECSRRPHHPGERIGRDDRDDPDAGAAPTQPELSEPFP